MSCDCCYCVSKPVVTTSSTTTTTTICPGEDCAVTYLSDDFVYRGPTLTCFGIEDCTPLTEILYIIADNLCNPTTTTTTTVGPTTTTTSTSSTTTTSSTSTTSTTTTSTSTTSTTTTSSTTTTTTTVAPTTTTTTAEPLPKSNFSVDNQLTLGGAEIIDITFNSVSVTLDLNYPITPTQGALGIENNGTYTVEVFFTGITGTEAISITDSGGSTVCQGLFSGQTSQVFSGQVLDDTLLPPSTFVISLKPGPC